MAVNFLHHLFQTKIESSAVSSDGYLPQNLASESWRERNQGFLAARFIKPPVQLVFQLPFPIYVQSLIIKPKVGLQISSGIDVFVAGIKHDCLGAIAAKQGRNSRQKTKTSSVSNTSVNESRPRTKRQRIELKVTDDKKQEIPSQEDENKSTDSDAFSHKYSTLITTDSFKNEHRNLFTLVSRINDATGRTVRVINRKYGGNTNQDTYTSEETIIYEFFQSNTLNYVTHVVICINRMKDSCVPALGRVDIWGKASVSCGESITNFISDIQNKICKQENVNFSTKVSNHDTSSRVSVDRGVSKDIHHEDEAIPSDFIDPITCSLMTIPMLLPSGLNVDLSTLEKHIEAEKPWGRLPSDPFTGVIFTDDVKPLTNAALKARIDKYILTSGVDVTSCGRTVGRPQDNLLPNKHNFQNISLNNKLGNAAMKGRMNNDLLRNGSKVECSVEKGDTSAHGQLVRIEKSEGKIGNNNQNEEEKVINVQSHEENVSQSLDNALMKTLQGAYFTRRGQDLPARNIQPVPCASSLVGNQGEQTRFGTLSKKASLKENRQRQGSSDCIECKKPLNHLIMFQLPCKHLMCRACLTACTTVSQTLECSLCSCVFSHKDVVRVHH